MDTFVIVLQFLDTGNSSASAIMSSSDWEEVKRLAADFQRAQLAQSVQRLSERNCVELINKLQELKLLKLHYTSDGKSYITPQQLHREMLDELFLAGGRINLVELSSLLGLDLSIIEAETSTLLQARTDLKLKLLLGQLLSPDYETGLAEQVSETLMRSGTIAVDDLATEYQLPGDYIRKVIESRLGKSIHAVQDSSNPDVFYTEQHLARLRARIRGLLTAVTTPTALQRLLPATQCSEKLFMGTVERLLSSGRVCGELSGSRQSRSCTFVPALHSRTQQQWVDNFLRQNGYLEYEFVRGLGIEDPGSFINTRYGATGDLLRLGGVCVGPALVQQIHTAIEEALATHSFVDIAMIVPSCLSEEERERLVEHVLQQRTGAAEAAKGGKGRRRNTSEGGSSGALVLEGSFVLSDVLVTAIKDKLLTEMSVRGQKLVAAGGYKPKTTGTKVKLEESESSSMSRKEERRRKAAGGKTGGGTQGRETKTRSTKGKKGRGVRQQDSDDEEAAHTDTRFPDVQYLPRSELSAELARMPGLTDADEDLVEALADDLLPWTNKTFASICEQSYQSLMTQEGSARKKTFQQVQDRLLGLLLACRLSERGMMELDGELQQQLAKHLLRTQCSELLCELLLYLSDGSTAQDTAAKDITPEARLRMVSALDTAAEGGCQESLLAAHRATSAASPDLTAFFAAMEDAITKSGILLPKKKDHKKDRQVLSSQRAALLQQLAACCEPALCLHVAALLLFQVVTGHMLQASGKFVPQLIAFLKPHLDQDLHLLLHEYQGLVMQKLTSTEGDVDISALNGRLEQLTPELKERASVFRKAAASAE